MSVLVLIPLLCTGLGLGIGQVYYAALRQGAFVRWKQLASPPYAVEALLAAGPDRLYVQTAQGIYFMTGVKGCLKPGKPDCWQPAAQVERNRLTDFPCSPDEAGSRFRVAAPPVPAVEELTGSECGREWYDETHYVRSGTGELWVWQWGEYGMGLIGTFFLLACGGPFVGLLVGGTLSLLLAWGGKKRLGRLVEPIHPAGS